MQLLWSQTIPSPLRGLSLARERDGTLAWDGQEDLFLFNHAGKIQAQRPSSVVIAAACCADDGSAYAIGGSRSPAVCWLAPDLSPRWQRPLAQRVTALALDSLGQFVAVADASCAVHLFDHRGHLRWQTTTPRPLCHLAFVPEKPVLVGAADFGLVLCFDSMGECLWRDGLVAHIGSLTVNGDGNSLLLACFGDGLVRYSVGGPRQQRITRDAPCHLAALSYAGDCLLTAERNNRVCLLNRDGVLRDAFYLNSPAVALSLAALGDYAVVGLADGSIHCLDTTRIQARI